MTTIIYKKLLGRYEIIEINGHRGEQVRIEFEEPIDGSLVLSDLPFTVMRGICSIDNSVLKDGYILPKLYTGGNMHTLEGFIIKKGAIIRDTPNEEYTKRLCVTVDALLTRIQQLEIKISELENKTERKITF